MVLSLEEIMVSSEQIYKGTRNGAFIGGNHGKLGKGKVKTEAQGSRL